MSHNHHHRHHQPQVEQDIVSIQTDAFGNRTVTEREVIDLGNGREEVIFRQEEQIRVPTIFGPSVDVTTQTTTIIEEQPHHHHRHHHRQ